MTNLLSYTSRPHRRWSRTAIAAVTLSILHVPLFYGLCYLIKYFQLSDWDEFRVLILMLLIPAVVAILLGLFACIRGLVSKGQLRGWWIGLLAVLFSAAFPVWVVLDFGSRLHS